MNCVLYDDRADEISDSMDEIGVYDNKEDDDNIGGGGGFLLTLLMLLLVEEDLGLNRRRSGGPTLLERERMCW